MWVLGYICAGDHGGGGGGGHHKYLQHLPYAKQVSHSLDHPFIIHSVVELK